MKKLLYFLCIVVLVSCADTKNSSPSGAMQAFFDAAKKGDIQELKKHVTSQDLAILQLGENFMKNMDSSAQRTMEDKMTEKFKEKIGNGTITISDEKIEGDKATLNVQYSMDEKQHKQAFVLQKENGEWKVALMASGMKNTNTSEAEMQEGMKKLSESINNLDGIKDSIGKAMKDFEKLDKDSLKKMMQSNKAEIDKVMKTLNISQDSLQKLIDKHQ
jgi:Domain of unknown function (DUF4878)